MTTLELKLELPAQLARQAEEAGLLTPDAVKRLLKDAVRAQAAEALLAGARRSVRAGRKPMPMRSIQRQVEAARRARRARSGKTA